MYQLMITQQCDQSQSPSSSIDDCIDCIARVIFTSRLGNIVLLSVELEGARVKRGGNVKPLPNLAVPPLKKSSTGQIEYAKAIRPTTFSALTPSFCMVTDGRWTRNG